MTIRIGVLSDTHIPIAAAVIPKEVVEGLAGTDLIVHAGDLVEPSVLKTLSGIAKVRAVRGNMDSAEVRSSLPDKDIIEIGGISIGLMHGWGPPSGLIELAEREFKGADVIIFGHSHNPLIENKGRVLFFNPGSPTDRIFAPYNSYGILEIENKIVTPRIIRLRGK
ncbi:MAG: metallophosphoesterase family protein [Candidatus Omnitrophica bacterium]|nr:metallophosphoesterase family protein [Candidatus Omnitrophota bacterium]